MSRCFVRCLGIALAIWALALPVQAQNVLSIRVENLDDLTADIDSIAAALGEEEGAGEGLLAMAQSMLGLPNLDWVDRKNPLVLALPLEGLMLGDQGFVGAFPVSDPDAAIEALKASGQEITTDEDGLIHMPLGGDQEIVMVSSKGYLHLGRNPSLVGGFDPVDLLAGANLPPGTVAAEFNVDSMRAMIGMGLQGARQQIGTVLAQAAEEGGEEIDAEAAAQASNLVVNWIETLIANTRSIQLSLEVSGSHLVVHNRYLPVAGSGLQAFLREQKGGMPDLARLVDGKDASMVLVANMTWTDEAIAAMNGFMEDYATLIQSSVLKQAGDNPIADMIPTLMKQYSTLWQCQRGDMAQVMDMSDGMRFVQVSGLKGGDKCGAMDQMTADIVASLPEELQEMFSFSHQAWRHKGVPVSTFTMDIGDLFMSQAAETARASRGEDVSVEQVEEQLQEVDALMKGLFGENGFEMYMGGVDNVWIGTGGAGGDAAMKAVIDRVKGGKRGQGIDPAVFAPFKVRAGAYFAMDFGKFFAGVGELLPEAEADEIAEIQQVFEALGAMTGALEFQTDALALKLALSTAGLGTVTDMIREERTPKAHDDHGGHGIGGKNDDRPRE
jgi:hypothetical protein